MSNLYYWYKEHGICVKCKSQDADKGHVTCLACRMDARQRKPSRSEESIRRRKEWIKRRNDLNYAFGVCVCCGQRDADKGSSSCSICKAKNRLCREKQRREKGIYARNSYTKNGICWFCNEPVLPGKKTCKKHYKQMCENMAKAASAPRKEDYFRKLNKAFWEGKRRNGAKI